jgi:unspecific monooxygenase
MVAHSTIPSASQACSLVQTIQWLKDPIGYMEKAAERYGDIFVGTISLKMDELVFVNHPEAVQQMLTRDRQEFSAPREVNKMLSMLFGDTSVLMLEGDRHQKRRQLLMPPFHGERMKTYGELIIELTQKVFDVIPQDSHFFAHSTMQNISLQVVIETVFGLYEEERCQKLKQLLTTWLESCHSLWQWDLSPPSSWDKLIGLRQQIDELLYAEISARRVRPDPKCTDILSLLMSATDETGNGLSDGELRDELLTLLFAGHETTAIAMAWSLYWTHYLPQVREKLLQELSDLGSNASPVEIAKLPYLTAVCQESLRIYPVMMLTLARKVEKPVELMGYHLEPGTVLAGCIYLIHQREDIYPDPKQFKPERFLKKQFSPYEFIPFGGGSRRCIGDALAQFEMKLVMATILSNYELTLANAAPEKPKRRGITLAPATGVKMVMKRRQIHPQKSS